MSTERVVALTSTVARNPEQVCGHIDAQAVLLSIENGRYYNMNQMGTRIWDRIEAPLQVDALIGQLLAEFDVHRWVCEAEVLAFLERLHQERLILVRQ